MGNNAIAIANYFVDKAASDSRAPHRLTLLRLVKYVYIAYGFALAILERLIIDERFDSVEAWKYGPVIPSVYHSFKHNANNPIERKEVVIKGDPFQGGIQFATPMVEDENVKKILDFVWNRYRDASTNQLIEIMHHEYTPWAYCYRVGKNNPIPHDMTKEYYKGIINNAKK